MGDGRIMAGYTAKAYRGERGGEGRRTSNAGRAKTQINQTASASAKTPSLRIGRPWLNRISCCQFLRNTLLLGVLPRKTVVVKEGLWNDGGNPEVP